MNINLFDYNLPEELIAQQPTRNRDQSRLMVVDRDTGQIEIKQFADIIDYLNRNDCLVVNNTKVFKARLIGHRATGGEAEVFLIRRLDNKSQKWLALAQPSRRLKDGEQIYFDNENTISLTLQKYLGDGRWEIIFNSNDSENRIINDYGHVPLPQYIKRDDSISDVSRYQTIFANDNLEGAVAAPTAGFHFTNEIIEKLISKGINKTELTLHVGPGTFKPVSVDNIEDHTVDPELATITAPTADLINKSHNVVSVGTTSCRTLESAEITNNQIQPLSRMVDLYIKPGYQFQVVDHLITNFHLPKSSLLILISAFAGRELVMEAYQKAIENKFRFYSYGDAMLII